jgi:hypothetical protein
MHPQYSIFAVDDVAYCVWDWDLKTLNLDFIDSIDHKYFEYSASTHVENLEGENKHRAATALRSSYHHALEILFALICAGLQAPDCVIGWIQKYQPSQLRRMVSSISKGNPGFQPKLKIEKITWDSIAFHFIRCSYPDANKTAETKQLFGKLWSLFAIEFIDEYSVWEYNSIKHGFRASPGGFALEVGIEDQYGVPAPPERMELLGSSEFGNSFSRCEHIFSSRNDPHLRVVRSSIAWDPESTAYALILLANSINNVVSFLKIANGVDPTSVPFARPVDADIFDKPWASPPGVRNFSMSHEISEKLIRRYTRKQLMELILSKSSGPASAAS